ncbi:MULTISPECIES: ribonuclease III [Aerosakkonema]|uniref:ribonuclease III n=1 Tax=Aerosakkonema TaxID=1246629 RepID=UPI0035BB5C09
MNLSYPRRQKQLQTLIQKLGLPEKTPVKWQLLDLALTHPTFSAEDNYDRLEFVGDSVVRVAAAEFLWETYPQSSVGDFSALRAELVSDRILAQIADSYGFEDYLLMDKSAAGDTAGRETRLADALEAVLGALYLSTHSLQLVRPWLDRHFKEITAEILSDPARRNYKAAFQEFTQAAYKILPEYEIREMKQVRGNTQMFTAVVKVLGETWGIGKGGSKKAAEQAAAKQAFEQIKIKMSIVNSQ